MRPAAFITGVSCQAASLELIRLPTRFCLATSSATPLRGLRLRAARPWRTRMRFSSRSGIRSAMVDRATSWRASSSASPTRPALRRANVVKRLANTSSSLAAFPEYLPSFDISASLHEAGARGLRYYLAHIRPDIVEVDLGGLAERLGKKAFLDVAVPDEYLPVLEEGHEPGPARARPCPALWSR